MLQTATANVLDLFAKRAPKIITSKAKIHMLVHMEEDFRRFGPLVGLSTERFESFNAVFRLSSVFSNRHHPSRDIAVEMANQERLKHIISGGLLRMEQRSGLSTWRRPGSGVTAVLREEGARGILNIFSYDDSILHRNGNSSRELESLVSSFRRTTNVPISELHSVVDKAAQVGKYGDEEFRGKRCEWVRSKNGDRVTSESWVFLAALKRKEPADDLPVLQVGRVLDIWAPGTKVTSNKEEWILSNPTAVVREYNVLGRKDPEMDAPVLEETPHCIRVSSGVSSLRPIVGELGIDIPSPVDHLRLQRPVSVPRSNVPRCRWRSLPCTSYCEHP